VNVVKSLVWVMNLQKLGLVIFFQDDTAMSMAKVHISSCFLGFILNE